MNDDNTIAEYRAKKLQKELSDLLDVLHEIIPEFKYGWEKIRGMWVPRPPTITLDTPSRLYLFGTHLEGLRHLFPTQFCDDEATKPFFEKTWLEFETEYDPKKGKRIRDLE